MSKYVYINGAKFKIILLEGTPPPTISIMTERGIKAIRTGRVQNVNIAYRNRDIQNISYKEYYREI